MKLRPRSVSVSVCVYPCLRTLLPRAQAIRCVNCDLELVFMKIPPGFDKCDDLDGSKCDGNGIVKAY